MQSADDSQLPAGFLYHPGFLTEKEERELVDIFRTLPFAIFEYRGFQAKRRIVAYGWTYDFNTNELSKGADIPDFLQPSRRQAAELASIPLEALEEALITEYSAGAQINWHRDLPMFEIVIGISMLHSCTFRLKSYKKEAKPLPVILEPRSAYVMAGAARWSYMHSIPPVKELRYSIIFRTLRKTS